MIRINLLSEGKRPTAVRKSTSGGGFTEREDLPAILMGLVLLLGLAAAGAWWWWTDQRLQSVREEVARTQAEVDRLQSVLVEVEEFKAKKAELEHKIEVINDLKENQRGPVRVMDNISRALPELLWIDQMGMKGTRITLTGRAFNVNAVANFIERLENVEGFEEPTRTKFDRSGPVYRYEIAFTYDPDPRDSASDAEAAASDEGLDAEDDSTGTDDVPTAAGG